MQNDAVLHEIAGALLDGTPIDWASAESNAVDESMRRVVRDLKMIAEIAEVHQQRIVFERPPASPHGR